MNRQQAYLGYGPKPLLTRGIPYLQADDCRGIDVDDALGQERGAYCRLGRGWCKCVLDVAMNERGFADSLTAQHHDLGLHRHGCLLLGREKIKMRLSVYVDEG